MPRDSSGNYSLPSGNPVSTGTAISSTVHNATNTDIASALTGSIAKNGVTTATADLPMGTNKHTNVGSAAARNQYAAAAQVQDGGFSKLGSVSGTDTIVGSLSPAITAYSAHMQVTFTPANTNTGAATIAVNGLTALDILKAGGIALVAGDLVAGVPAFLVLDTGADDFYLLNPQHLVPDDEITFARMQNITTDRLLGRDTASTGNVEEIGVSGGLEFTGSGGIQRSALTGDVTATAGSNATTIANDAVTNAKAANMAANTIKGRITGSTGDPEDLTAANVAAIVQSSLSIATSQLTGTLPDARVAQSNVTQHQAALSVATSQLTGTLADARVAQSNVTQHQAAINIATSQVTSGTFADARIAQSNVTQHQAAIKGKNVTGLAGTAVTIQADPGGTPSGSPGDMFLYW